MGIWDTLTGQDASAAANNAAAITAKKQKQATEQLRKDGNTYNAGMQTVSQAYNPYVSAGTDALGMYRAGLGLDGGAGSQAFTDAYRATPGYGAALETGQNSLLQQLNASGRLNTGAAQKAAMQYGQNFEDQRSGNYLNQLMGLSNTGLQATGQQVATQSQGLQGQLGARTTAYGGDMASAGTIGQGLVAGANAETGAMTNLLSAGAGLAGAAMGGGFGGAGTSLAGLFGGNRGSSYSTSNPYQAAPGNWGNYQFGGQNVSVAR